MQFYDTNTIDCIDLNLYICIFDFQETMKNHTNVNKIHSLDPNYKAMMKCLGVQNSDYKTLTLEFVNFKESLNVSYTDIEEDMRLFQKRFTER